MRKCKVCKEPHNNKIIANICSPQCGYELTQINLKKKKKQDFQKLKQKVRGTDRSFQLKRTQAKFNEYIRLRDSQETCISCNQHHQGQYHAGHYRTVGAHPELRFNELNCHKQCAPCNNHKSGNIVEYRINLATRIGMEKLEWIEGPHQSQKYTIEDIREIYDYYKAKIIELNNK